MHGWILPINPITFLKNCGISPTRGFLPDPDLQEDLRLGDKEKREMPDYIKGLVLEYENIVCNLPKLLVAGRLREELKRVGRFEANRIYNFGKEDIACLGRPTLDLLMRDFSFLGHAFVHGSLCERPLDRLPSPFAILWFWISQTCGRPPVLSYDSYALCNWKRLERSGPIALGNIALIRNFLGGFDEDWFILVHVDIEARAGLIPLSIVRALQAVSQDSPEELELSLGRIARALRQMHEVLSRMPEGCDPYIYYNRVRPFIHGWKDNPAFPDGVVYGGVQEYNGEPQKFRGETGAQSSIIPSVDAVLDIPHEEDKLTIYLREMRDYMPPGHRIFIKTIEKATEGGLSVREYVRRKKLDCPALRDAYKECLSWLVQFRSKHLQYAAQYVQKQTQSDAGNPTEVGTGGTPFMPYLKKHDDDTLKVLKEF